MFYTYLLAPLVSMALAAADPPPSATAGNREESEALTPEAGILFEPGYPYHYHQSLLRLLLSAANTPNRKCQMVLEDGFVHGRGEVAVFFERARREQPPVVISRVARKSIAAAVGRALDDPKRPEGSALNVDVREQDVRQGQATLADDTGYLLEQICEVMLGTTRYPREPVFYNDARAAHFAHHDLEHGYRAGQTTSRTGRVSRFVQLLLDMSDFAMAPEGERLTRAAKLKQAASTFLAELKAAGFEIPNVKARRGSAELPRPERGKSKAQ